jgi:two-component system, NarL family, response regulator NreC
MKILVADDHPIFRKGLIDIIKSAVPDSDIIEAENGLQAAEKIVSLKPDIAFLDVEMPGEDGIKICRSSKADRPYIKIIILTMYKSGEVLNMALNSGADGFILKDNSAGEIMECIDTVMAGKQYISPDMQKHLNNMDVFRKKRNEIETGLLSLTKTEKKVLQMVSNNLSSKEIALRLFITQEVRT